MPKQTLPKLRALLLDPQADPLTVGLELAALTAGDLGGLGYGSLTKLLEDLLPDDGRPDYSTVMRWVRAASVLDGADDPRREWGLSRLVEVGSLSPPERDQLLVRCDPGIMSVRGLRNAIIGLRDENEVDGPHRVLERAIGVMLRQRSGDAPPAEVTVRRGHGKGGPLTFALSSPAADGRAAEALTTAAGVVEAISSAKAAWVHQMPPVVPEVPRAMPLKRILELPPGQLEVRWEGTDLVCVLKAGRPILWVPVERARREDRRLTSGTGNRKLRGVFGLIDSISQGCLRRATGFVKSDVSCFSMDIKGPNGCYIDHTPWANSPDNIPENMRRSWAPWSVIDNGITNGCLRIRLPLNGSPRLDARQTQRLWRVDAESADGAMSIGLGIFQRWSEANPEKRFFTICSHHVRPSSEMLAWTAALRNAWIGHTVSGWLDPLELDVRLTSLQRFLDFGVPSVIWIVTHESWDNRAVLDRVISMGIPPEHVIEAPYRHGTKSQDLPLLNINRRGACSDNRVSARGMSCHVEWQDSDKGSEPVAVLVGPDGPVDTDWKHSKCAGCDLRCGHAVIELAADAKPSA